MSIDWTTTDGVKAAGHLRTLPVAWLPTVGENHTPYPSVVWFWWDGGEILVYSQPHTLKLRNIATRRNVSLSLQVDSNGETFTVVTGPARIDQTHPGADEHTGYRIKYTHLMETILGWTPEEFAAGYSVPVLIDPRRLRGY